MQESTGNIFEFKAEEERKKKEKELGEALVSIPDDQIEKVKKMNRQQRRAWAAKQRKASK